jgi:hypothetical protein
MEKKKNIGRAPRFGQKNVFKIKRKIELMDLSSSKKKRTYGPIPVGRNRVGLTNWSLPCVGSLFLSS